jgi:hypothetical protein
MELIIVLLLIIGFFYLYAMGQFGGVPKLIKILLNDNFEATDIDCDKKDIVTLLEHKKGDDPKIDMLFKHIYTDVTLGDVQAILLEACPNETASGTSASGTSASGTSASGTSASGTSASGTSASGTSASGTTPASTTPASTTSQVIIEHPTMEVTYEDHTINSVVYTIDIDLKDAIGISLSVKQRTAQFTGDGRDNEYVYTNVDDSFISLLPFALSQRKSFVGLIQNTNYSPLYKLDYEINFIVYSKEFTKLFQTADDKTNEDAAGYTKYHGKDFKDRECTDRARRMGVSGGCTGFIEQDPNAWTEEIMTGPIRFYEFEAAINSCNSKEICTGVRTRSAWSTLSGYDTMLLHPSQLTYIHSPYLDSGHRAISTDLKAGDNESAVWLKPAGHPILLPVAQNEFDYDLGYKKYDERHILYENFYYEFPESEDNMNYITKYDNLQDAIEVCDVKSRCTAVTRLTDQNESGAVTDEYSTRYKRLTWEPDGLTPTGEEHAAFSNIFKYPDGVGEVGLSWGVWLKSPQTEPNVTFSNYDVYHDYSLNTADWNVINDIDTTINEAVIDCNNNTECTGILNNVSESTYSTLKKTDEIRLGLPNNRRARVNDLVVTIGDNTYLKPILDDILVGAECRKGFDTCEQQPSGDYTACRLKKCWNPTQANQECVDNDLDYPIYVGNSYWNPTEENVTDNCGGYKIAGQTCRKGIDVCVQTGHQNVEIKIISVPDDWFDVTEFRLTDFDGNILAYTIETDFETTGEGLGNRYFNLIPDDPSALVERVDLVFSASDMSSDVEITFRGQSHYVSALLPSDDISFVHMQTAVYNPAFWGPYKGTGPDVYDCRGGGGSVGTGGYPEPKCRTRLDVERYCGIIPYLNDDGTDRWSDQQGQYHYYLDGPHHDYCEFSHD